MALNWAITTRKEEAHMIKPSRKTIETSKTIVITILLTAFIAFVAGVKYAEVQQSRVDSAVKAATAVKKQ